ncbi:hypothetical protein F4815DRAFT_456185 [Daldinia loculata]|nr:hypothetical protein F4815DRAFT_456185 [Daldinia loculata]
MDQLAINQHELPSHFFIHPKLEYFIKPAYYYLRQNFPQCTELIIQVAAFNGEEVLMERDPVRECWSLLTERYDGQWSSMLHFVVYIVRVRSGFTVENVDRLLSIALDWIDEKSQSLRVRLTFAVNVYSGDYKISNPCNMWATEAEVEALQQQPEVRVYPTFVRGLLSATFKWRHENLIRFSLVYPKIQTFPEPPQAPEVPQATHGGATIATYLNMDAYQ